MSATRRLPAADPCWHCVDNDGQILLTLHGEWDIAAEADLQLMTDSALEADQLTVDLSSVTFSALRLAEWLIGVGERRRDLQMEPPRLILADPCARLFQLVGSPAGHLLERGQPD